MAERRSTVLLLLGMIAWVAAGLVAAFVLSVVAVGGALAWLHHGLGPELVGEQSVLLYVLVGSTAFQATLLAGAVRQGRLAGNGDWRFGLGIGRIRHVGRVALLCVVMIGCLLGFVLLSARIPALRDFAKSVTPDIMARLEEGGPFAVMAKVALAVVLAPISEELFFRGWLWESLRRRGHGVLSTACLTALPWLLLHGLDSPARVLFLLPAALVFSLARHYGGSVLASLVVHVTNNAVAVLLEVIAVVMG